MSLYREKRKKFPAVLCMVVGIIIILSIPAYSFAECTTNIWGTLCTTAGEAWSVCSGQATAAICSAHCTDDGYAVGCSTVAGVMHSDGTKICSDQYMTCGGAGYRRPSENPCSGSNDPCCGSPDPCCGVVGQCCPVY